jgi:diaminopimelate epimerase
VNFVKMHGLGNDFIVVNGFEEHLDDSKLSELARKTCDRHFGIGGDGLVLVLPSQVADHCMRMINPDGSEAEMCGNGIRCAAKFAYERGICTANPVRIETLAGVKVIDLTLENGKVTAARVDMGKPRLDRTEIPFSGPGNGPVIGEVISVEGREFAVTCVSMGNPHCITFVDNAETYPIDKIGPLVEHHPDFPQRTTTEFVQIINRGEIRMRVWERGAGQTLACGTGACASAAAAMLNGLTDRTVTVHLDGGDLLIEWASVDADLMMTGPAEEVFVGVFPAS